MPDQMSIRIQNEVRKFDETTVNDSEEIGLLIHASSTI